MSVAEVTSPPKPGETSPPNPLSGPERGGRIATAEITSAAGERGRRVAGLVARWEWLALAGVLVLAGLLRIVGLEREAFANTYYAAAVKSMLTGWRAFFFASFDSAGFVTVDKP